LSEAELIKKYFSKHHQASETVELSVGDDAAIVLPPDNSKLVITTDTLNVGVHFHEDCEAGLVGYKSLAVSLSDIASMGAVPLWATLNLSLPSINHSWLKEFSEGLYELADAHDVKVVGGDTVKGSLSITVQIIGYLKQDQKLLRSACQTGDYIYATGTLGDAALGLELLRNNQTENINSSRRDYFINRLQKPTPRLNVSTHIVHYAHAAIDISDGFLIDLQRMLSLSNKAANIELENIPISDAMRPSIHHSEDIMKLLTGGEDYELIFTIDPNDQVKLKEYVYTENILVTKVGEIVEGCGISLSHHGVSTKLPNTTGFDHFQ